MYVEDLAGWLLLYSSQVSLVRQSTFHVFKEMYFSSRRSDDAPLLPENNKSLTKDETTTSSTAAAGAAKAFSLLSLAFVFMQVKKLA